MKTGLELISEERQRQIEVEGWSADHDDRHTDGELALAAALYATPKGLYRLESGPASLRGIDPWPWHEVQRQHGGVCRTVNHFDKRATHSKLRRLVIAGALVAAEIDRLQRTEERRQPMDAGDHGEEEPDV